jgi:hypothetical protein
MAKEQGMAEQVRVYLPHVEEEASGAGMADRLDTLAGKTIGLLNNGWRSVNIMYEEFTRLLIDKYEVGSVIQKSKPYPSLPLAKETLGELAEAADGVIVALGN